MKSIAELEEKMLESYDGWVDSAAQYGSINGSDHGLAVKILKWVLDKGDFPDLD